MEYDHMKLQKTVQDSAGHLFDIDWDAGAGRCPTCGLLVTVQVFRPQFYRANDLVTLNSGAVKRYLLAAPNTLTRVHLTYLVLNDNNITYELFRAPAVSANGTPVSILNNNENSTTPPELVIYADPTVSADGTRIDWLRIPADRGRTIPPHQLPGDEFIMLQNTVYQLKLTGLNNNTNVTSRFDFIEVK